MLFNAWEHYKLLECFGKTIWQYVARIMKILMISDLWQTFGLLLVPYLKKGMDE